MATLIKQVHVVDPAAGIDTVEDVLISPEAIVLSPSLTKNCSVIDGRNLLLIPGLVDLHVHFREPGFVHKEDIASGIAAALASGITSALVMPNTKPALDSYKSVLFQHQRAKRFGFDLMVAAAASKGLLGKTMSDCAELKKAGAKAVTDDGHPILDDHLMEKILRSCRRHNLICMQHAEDLKISHNASLHEGKVSKSLSLKGQPAAAEADLIARDIALAERIGARYHALHISCAESLHHIRAAKRRKSTISCEVSPHHLLLSEAFVKGLNTTMKMNPPLRGTDDAAAMIEALQDGTIDAVATDHAPHSKKEKRLPFDKAPFGVVGMESAFLVLLSLVKKRKLSLTRAIVSMTAGPAKILQEEKRIGTMFAPTALKNAVLIDPQIEARFSARKIFSRSKNSPFIGYPLTGQILTTFLHGEIVHKAFRSGL